MTFFKELEQIILKFIQNHKRLQIAKAIWRKKNKAGDITLPDFRLYYKAKSKEHDIGGGRKKDIDQWKTAQK